MSKPIGTSLAVLVCLVSVVFGVSNDTTQNKKPTRSAPIPDLSDRIDHIRSSVVRVLVRFEDGQVSDGSGFIVNKDGCVVTAYHVVIPHGRTTGEIKKARITVEVPIPPTRLPHEGTITGSFVATAAKVIATDSAHDIAILAAPEIMTKKMTVRVGSAGTHVGAFTADGANILPRVLPARLAAVPIKDGEPVFVSGYPLELPVLITTSGFVASSVPLTFDPTNRDLLDTYWLDIQANPGNSGGPVFSMRTGNVIAVQVGVQLTAVKYLDGTQGDASLQVLGLDGKVAGTRPIGYNAGIAKVVPAKYVQDLLIKNGIMF